MKRISIGILVVISSISMHGCSRNEEIGGGLVISQEDSSHVYLYRKDSAGNHVVVDQQIVDFLIQDGFLLILRKVAENYECDERGSTSIITHYSPKTEYWIVEISGGGVLGPLNKDEFEASLTQREIRVERTLQSDGYYSNSAVFDKIRENCLKLNSI